MAMNAVINFFALRPVFTFYGIKTVWYLYLLNMLIQLYLTLVTVSNLLAQRGISWEAWAPNALPLIVQIIAQLGLVRLLVEVAAYVLLSPKPSRT